MRTAQWASRPAAEAHFCSVRHLPHTPVWQKRVAHRADVSSRCGPPNRLRRAHARDVRVRRASN